MCIMECQDVSALQHAKEKRQRALLLEPCRKQAMHRRCGWSSATCFTWARSTIANRRPGRKPSRFSKRTRGSPHRGAVPRGPGGGPGRVRGRASQTHGVAVVPATAVGRLLAGLRVVGPIGDWTISGRSAWHAPRKGTRWVGVLQTLCVYRLIRPGSEWRLHRQWFEHSAMARLAGRGLRPLAADRQAVPLSGHTVWT